MTEHQPNALGHVPCLSISTYMFSSNSAEELSFWRWRGRCIVVLGLNERRALRTPPLKHNANKRSFYVSKFESSESAKSQRINNYSSGFIQLAFGQENRIC